jgi:hypothetical protein
MRMKMLNELDPEIRKLVGYKIKKEIVQKANEESKILPYQKKYKKDRNIYVSS